jgi:DNA-binding MarR family transcriptional regulator
MEREPADATRSRDDVARIAHAWRELRRGAAMTALKERMQGETGLDLGQVDFLEHLVIGGTARMRDLADTLRVDASTATRAVQRLVESGLAERSADERDARCVHVSATDEGRAKYDEIVTSRRAGMEELLSDFSRADLRSLADGMEKLVAALDAMVSVEA